jgi:hypothetical protein
VKETERKREKEEKEREGRERERVQPIWSYLGFIVFSVIILSLCWQYIMKLTKVLTIYHC